MKIHTTNYFNTFIEVAEDCPISSAEVPPIKGDKKTVANLQFELLYDHPYQFTSDEILFKIFAIRKEIPKRDLEEERKKFFSKGQACFRASPLTKKYAWGVHSNEDGKIAIFPVESKEYQSFLTNGLLIKKKAMRSKRK